MDRLEFGCICELAEIMDNYVATNTSENEYPIVSAYMHHNEAKALVETLIRLDNSIGDVLELEDYEMAHYNKEYRISLTIDGVACEKIFCEDCYYDSDEDIAFVYEDCNSKLLSHIDSEVIYEFSIGECEDDEEDCDCDCDECCECQCNEDTDVEDDTHGFTVSKSDENGYSFFSFYSSEELTKEDINTLLKRFGF